MEFIKNGDSVKIIEEGKEVGSMEIKRYSYSGQIEGYSIGFNTKIMGYGYGGFAKSYKKAQKVAEVNWYKLQEQIKKCPYYIEEINTYFVSESSYKHHLK